jgi:deoxyribodipyrimidine photo-lyase
VHLVELPLLAGKSRVGGIPRCAPRRCAFWRECVEDLAQRLEERGQRLLVRAVESPADFFADLCSRFPVAKVYAHREFCDEELQVEAKVRAALAAKGAQLQTFWGSLTVVHIDDLGFDPSDPKQMPMFKGEFNGIAKKRRIREVMPVPATLRPSPPDLESAEYGSAAIATAFSAGPTAPPLDDRQPFVWRGGETAALQHLRWYMDSGQLKNYRGATESFAHGEHNPVNGGTRLSPWLAFGCLSARTVVHESREYERKHGKSSSTGKGSGKMGSTGARLHTELNFRDFLRFSALSWGTNLFKVGGPFRVKGIKWNYDKEKYAKWQAGETGFPFVDAGMRELALTGYISHLHRQCCAAFLVRDLRLDWRMGAEHFEACLLDHTPDANWGNWSYRVLQRPGLVETRQNYPLEDHITTVECIAWPAVHDARLEHTLRWVPELRGLPRDVVREPWRLETLADKRIKVKPYKDSPLWFCAANRVNWDYEYFWLPGHAWTVRRPGAGRPSADTHGVDFCLGRDYPRPVVPPLNLEIDLDALPVSHGWGDTAEPERPHIWGTPGDLEQRDGVGAPRGKGEGGRRRKVLRTRNSE